MPSIDDLKKEDEEINDQLGLANRDPKKIRELLYKRFQIYEGILKSEKDPNLLLKYGQMLGIYFPAVVLVAFFYVYGDYLSSFYGPLKVALEGLNNWYLTLLTLIGIVVITGESINVFTSKLSFLSPGPVGIIDKLKKMIGQDVKPHWLYRVKWPTWFGIPDYPITFSSFDRYYLESLDKEKRSLAGKIGWTTFFRNMSVVFSIIFITQMILFVYHSEALTISNQSINVAATSSLANFMIDPNKIIPLVLTFALSLIFYLGYRSNRRSYDLVLWKSYRRNEFIKWFETKFGNPQTVFGINSNNLTQAIDFVTDTLYYSSDRYLKDFSSIILTKLENSYRTTKKLVDDNSQSNTTCDYHNSWRRHIHRNASNPDVLCAPCRSQISKSVENTVTLMNYCYKDWRDGSHELVLEKCFDGLEELSRILQNKREEDNILETEFWQKMRGFLLLSENIYTSHAFTYITEKLAKWDWVNKSTESPNQSSEEMSESSVYRNMNENLVLTYDDWHRAITSIERFIEKHSTSTDTGPEFFEQFKVSNTLRDFGGYNYVKSIDNLEALEKRLQHITEYSWHGIIISYDKQWKLKEVDDNYIKIVLSNLIGNGMIDIWSENNTNMLSNSLELYNYNCFKIEVDLWALKGITSREIKKITSREIIVMDTLASLILFSYQDGVIEKLGYQILFTGGDDEELFFIKYEEEKTERSSVELFEKIVYSLRRDEWW